MTEKVTIGNCTLYHGDCREVLPLLPPVDLVLTDPPYGIGEAWGSERSWQGRCGKGRLWVGEPEWDTPPGADLLSSLCDRPCIIWGGNYFPNLPTSKAWLVWDKCADMTQAHAELAWTNCAPTVRTFRKSPLGAFGNGGANGEVKDHPTQKPTPLMEWCLSFVPSAKTILDPFMGSGTTGVACMNLGRSFIGIERERKYFDIACRRIEQAYAQPRLFKDDKQQSPQEQVSLLDGIKS